MARARWLLAACGLGAACAWSFADAPSALSQQVYTRAYLAGEAERLKTAVRKILTIGLQPAMTAKERQALEPVGLEFPMPKPNDAVLNFYAAIGVESGTVYLPLQSLKKIEDMTLAYAVLYYEQKSLEPVDLYFSVVRNQTPSQFPDGRLPNILAALGIPENAYKRPGIDKLSLSLRNEAFAFVLAHELAHILYRHKGYAKITKAQARADEVQADAFALDLMARTNTPPLGAALFFRAQVYGLPHPGQYPTKELWNAYLATASTHPLSVDRMRAMARMIKGPLARRRPNEARIWREIGTRLEGLAGLLDDAPLHRCITQMASELPLKLLRGRPITARSVVAERGCR
ncbi:MAG: M48 family metalloprotease [Pseudomonadota bacterium]